MADQLTPVATLNMVIQDRLEKIKLTGFRTLANFADRGMITTYNDTDINWTVDPGGEGANWAGITAVSTTSNQGNTVKAALTYGDFRLYHRFDINKVDFQVAARRAVSDLANLFGSHTDRALLALFRQLNAAIYLADGTATYGNMIGLNKVIDNSSAYAGINPATQPLWKALRNTSATRALAVATPAAGAYSLTINGVACTYTAVGGDNEAAILTGLRQAVLANFSDAQVDIDLTAKVLRLYSNPEWTVTPSGSTLTVGSVSTQLRKFDRNSMLIMDQLMAEQETMYDMVVTTPSVGKNYTQVFDTIAGVRSVANGPDSNQLRTVDLGHNGRLYNGYPLVEDYMATKGNIWLLDSQAVKLMFFQLDNMTSYGYAGHEINSSYGIPIHIWEVPPTVPTVRTFEMFVVPQLMVRNRKSVATIENIG